MSGKITLLAVFVILLILSIPCAAQDAVSGRILNEDGEPLPFATVVLLSPADSTVQYYDVADDNGKYRITNIDDGEYIMQYSFVGMEVIYREVTIPLESGEDLGDTMMKVDINVTDEVEVLAERIPIQVVKDTVTFDAEAFKTRTGAVVEELLEKLPGVEVDKSGNVKALGEDVTKVLVDGKVFFGNDPKVATKNLPADAIDKVQVYDKRSEEAEFMGIDDGTYDRTINLLLNEDSKKGYFGNISGGIGTEEHYTTKGDIYRFSSTIQSALLGMSNDINQLRISEPGGKFGQETPGLNKSTVGGLNLSYNTTKYNRYFLSYTGSSTDRTMIENTSTENFLEDGSYFQDKDLNSENTSKPHNINFGIHHNFKKHRFTLDGNMNVSSNDNVSHTLTQTTDDDGSLVNMLNNNSNSVSDNVNANTKATYIVQFNERKTQVKAGFNASYNRNSSELDYTNTMTLYDPFNTLTNDHYQDNDTENLTFNFSPTLVQMITPFWNMNTGVNIGSNDRNLNRKQGNSGLTEVQIDSLSTDFNTNELYVSPFVNIQRNTEKEHVNFGLRANWNSFDKVLYGSSLDKANYFYLLPSFNYNNNYREGRRIQVRYTSSASMPGLNSLLPVLNAVNPVSQYQGNINLKPEKRHNLNLQWTRFDAFSFTSLFWSMNALYTKDKVSSSQTLNDDLTQFNTPVNVPDQYNLSSQIEYSTPIRALSVVVDARWSESWSKGSNIINGEDNFQTVLGHSLRLNVRNRKTENWYASAGASVSINEAKFSIAESMNNKYYNTTYYTDLYWWTDQWTAGADANIVNYNSQSFDESVSVPLINASISYNFLEGNWAGLTLLVHDLLDKYSGFERISGANFLMERERNNIGRYVMLTFTLRRGGGAGRGKR
ncbi:outer membrane beta-barrel protein [candidate division KSB1 bacterium]